MKGKHFIVLTVLLAATMCWGFPAMATTNCDATKAEANYSNVPPSIDLVQYTATVNAADVTSTTANTVWTEAIATCANEGTTLASNTIDKAKTAHGAIGRASPNNHVRAYVDCAVENTPINDEKTAYAVVNRAGPTANCADVEECSTPATGAPANLATTDYPNPTETSGSVLAISEYNPSMQTVNLVDEGAQYTIGTDSGLERSDHRQSVDQQTATYAYENAAANERIWCRRICNDRTWDGTDMAANSRMKTTIRATDVSKAMAIAGGIQDCGAMQNGLQTAETNLVGNCSLVNQTTANVAGSVNNTVVENVNLVQYTATTIAVESISDYPNPFNSAYRLAA